MPVVPLITLICSALLVPVIDMGTRPEKHEMPLGESMPTEDMTASGMATSADVVADASEHDWAESYAQACDTAQARNLPLLMHFDAKWCGACRTMEANVLSKPQVRQLLGTSIIGVRIDADQHPDLIARYGINTLPTEVVVLPDGSTGGRYVGAVSLSTYQARLRSIQHPAPETKTDEAQVADSGDNQQEPSTRSCLIVERDGKMVGLGGFSPVALSTERKWKQGSEEFVADHEGVDYFLQSMEERDQFMESPDQFIPKLHGCDLVELQLQKRATAGAIEYGSIYKGRLFFFASIQNRDRFQNNPTWYLDVMTNDFITNAEMYPFLK